MTELDRTAAQAAVLALIPGSVPVGTWKVYPARNSVEACTMLDTREAHLPSGALPEDRLILIHEEGHVRWDLPTDQIEAAFPAIRMPYVAEFYMMLREWVIDMRLTAYVEDIRPSSNLKDWTNLPDPAGHPIDAIARECMQWLYRSKHPDVVQECELRVAELWSLIDPKGQQLLAEAYNDIGANLLDDTVSEQWAVTLAGHFMPHPPPPQKVQQPPEAPGTAQKRQAAEEAAAAQQQATQIVRQIDAIQQATNARMDPAQAARESSTETFTGAVDENGLDQWGDGQGSDHSKGSGGASDSIKLHKHMDRRRLGKRIKDPIGMKRDGSVPTHTEYLRMGGAIFKESPKPSGTILIDVSSSMQWSEAQLQQAIKLAPNLIVAGYSYRRSTGSMLCIIAQGGRTSQSLPCASGGSNTGSDIPALLWLEQQPEPRIILSDGAYYGGAGCGIHYGRVCRAIMKRAHITRVETMADALTWLRGRLTPASVGDEYARPTPMRRKH